MPDADSSPGLVTHGPWLGLSPEPDDDAPTLWLRGTGLGLDDLDDPREVDAVAEHLADGLADDNAEDVDRRDRGEDAHPLWELPGRRRA